MLLYFTKDVSKQDEKLKSKHDGRMKNSNICRSSPPPRNRRKSTNKFMKPLVNYDLYLLRESVERY